jgi:hypothetical protein
MRSKQIILTTLAMMFFTSIIAQSSEKKKPPVSISGTAGVSYESYGLSRKPTGWTGFTPRKPWNQVRFILIPKSSLVKISVYHLILILQQPPPIF